MCNIKEMKVDCHNHDAKTKEAESAAATAAAPSAKEKRTKDEEGRIPMGPPRLLGPPQCPMASLVTPGQPHISGIHPHIYHQ